MIKDFSVRYLQIQFIYHRKQTFIKYQIKLSLHLHIKTIFNLIPSLLISFNQASKCFNVYALIKFLKYF